MTRQAIVFLAGLLIGLFILGTHSVIPGRSLGHIRSSSGTGYIKTPDDST